MKLHIVVMAEFRNNLDCFTSKSKRVGLLADGVNASAVSELRLKQKPERHTHTHTHTDEFCVGILQNVPSNFVVRNLVTNLFSSCINCDIPVKPVVSCGSSIFIQKILVIKGDGED
jgi:hypothetical protein